MEQPQIIYDVLDEVLLGHLEWLGPTGVPHLISAWVEMGGREVLLWVPGIMGCEYGPD